MITSQMLYRLSYRVFSYKTAKIFLSTQLIGGDHRGVSTPCYVLLTSQLTPSHGTCYGRSKSQLMWRLHMNETRCVLLASQQAPEETELANDRHGAKVEIRGVLY